MSARVTLTPRAGVTGSLEVERLTADQVATLSENEIAQLPVWTSGRRAVLGEFFAVRGGNAEALVIQGPVAQVHGIGMGMLGGELLIDGDAGNATASEMRGGRVEVRGGAGDDAGAGMSGGTLDIAGDAGDRLGAGRPGAQKGMTGGEIVVRGSAGVDAGATCRRGLIVVMGNAGADAARSMIAGSLLVGGRCGGGAARLNKRGSVIAIGGLDVPSSYRYACTYRPPHLRVTFTYLARQYGLLFDTAVVNGRYQRFCGDLLAPAKGEILVWDGD
jgi:formylmethanofuran dehydrogenase subunit C